MILYKGCIFYNVISYNTIAKKTQQPPAQKEQEETLEIMVKGSDNTFMVTQ
jgi:hypothetical protein